MCTIIVMRVSLGPVLLLSTTSRPVGIWFLGNRSFRDIEIILCFLIIRDGSKRGEFMFSTRPPSVDGVQCGPVAILYIHVMTYRP